MENNSGAPTNQNNIQQAEPSNSLGLSANQIKDLADHEVKAGRLTREQADQMLKNDGYSTEKETIAHPLDEHFPAAKPHEYNMPMLFDPNKGEKFTPELQELDKNLRNVFSKARFTKEMGSYLLKEIDRNSDQYESMSDDQKIAYLKSEGAKLEKIYKDQLDSKLKLANQLLDEMDAAYPGFKDMLDEMGALSTATVMNQFINQAQILYERGEK